MRGVDGTCGCCLDSIGPERLAEGCTTCDRCVTRHGVAGWTRIGVWCSAGRRSLWARGGLGEPLELCAGRGGDDEYVRVEPGNPAYLALCDVVGAAKFAART